MRKAVGIADDERVECRLGVKHVDAGNRQRVLAALALPLPLGALLRRQVLDRDGLMANLEHRVVDELLISAQDRLAHKIADDLQIQVVVLHREGL